MYGDQTPNVPTLFVIFGITGDLSQRKLIPALLDLYVKEELPTVFSIIGFARRPYDNDELRAFLREAIAKKGHNHPEEKVEAFLENITYVQGLFEDVEAYNTLRNALETRDKEIGQCTNKLCYLAVGPNNYEGILDNLKKSGLNEACSEDTGWTRILIEKPFGRDLETAERLEDKLNSVFKDEQIYRIDHYMAKETVQNLLAFRFSNALFEPIWNSDHIEEVYIRAYEEIDASGRGGFYDTVGALRDVGQNHVLQLLAFIAMEEPKKLEADALRAARADVFKDLSLIDGSVRRAQYKGFRDTEGVHAESDTETYFKVSTLVDNKRWKNVPFHLEAGKALHAGAVEIEMHVKATETMHFIPPTDRQCRNTITFTIQPNESIAVSFWVKKPGFTRELEQQKLTFEYDDSPETAKIPDAYERVLVDAVRGDQTAFTSTDEVKASWKFITPILKNWDGVALVTYTPGSNPQDFINN